VQCRGSPVAVDRERRERWVKKKLQGIWDFGLGIAELRNEIKILQGIWDFGLGIAELGNEIKKRVRDFGLGIAELELELGNEIKKEG